MPQAVHARTSRFIDEECDDDAALVARAKFDPRAFAPLYQRYVDRDYRYCDRCLGQSDLAEDATSLIFTKALTALPTCQDESFRAWLFAIAHNVIIDTRRRQKPHLSLTDVATIEDGNVNNAPETQALVNEVGDAPPPLLEPALIETLHDVVRRDDAQSPDPVFASALARRLLADAALLSPTIDSDRLAADWIDAWPARPNAAHVSIPAIERHAGTRPDEMAATFDAPPPEMVVWGTPPKSTSRRARSASRAVATALGMAALLLITLGAVAATGLLHQRPMSRGTGPDVIPAPQSNPVQFLWESRGLPTLSTNRGGLDVVLPMTDPYHFAIDPSGNIWVPDTWMNQFRILAPDGSYGIRVNRGRTGNNPHPLAPSPCAQGEGERTSSIQQAFSRIPYHSWKPGDKRARTKASSTSSMCRPSMKMASVLPSLMRQAISMSLMRATSASRCLPRISPSSAPGAERARVMANSSASRIWQSALMGRSIRSMALVT